MTTIRNSRDPDSSFRGTVLLLLTALFTTHLAQGTQWRVACTVGGDFSTQPQCISYRLSDDDGALLPPECPKGFIYDNHSQLCLSGISEGNINKNHNVSGLHETLVPTPAPHIFNVVLCWPPDLFEVRRGKCRTKRRSHVTHESSSVAISVTSTSTTPTPSNIPSNVLPMDPPSPCPHGLIYMPLCGSVSQPLSRTGCCCGINGCRVLGRPQPTLSHPLEEPNHI